MRNFKIFCHRFAVSLFVIIFIFAKSIIADESITYTIPEAGRVSLAVYNINGQLVRTLLTGKPHKVGQYTINWDGRDRYGNALPAGNYSWKLLSTKGLRAEFITQIGQNPNPAWEKGVSNHESPMAAAVDASGIYRFGVYDENAYCGVKTDFEGRYQWSSNHPQADPWCQYGASMSVIDNQLFMLVFNGTVDRFDTKTGKCLTSPTGEGLWNVSWEGGSFVAKSSEAEKLRQYVGDNGLDMSSAISAGLLVVSYRKHNAIRWFNAENGKMVAEASVPEPMGVAALSDGTALVISKGEVVAISPDNKSIKTIIPANLLQNPWRLCVSPISGDIFLAENSLLTKEPVKRPEKNFNSAAAQDLSAGVVLNVTAEDQHHQVKRFSANGKLIATFGKPEGRKDGIYNPADFRCLTDIEADYEGGFIISEGYHQPPRRSARFDANGNLIREWLGAQEYGILAVPEPGNPEYVWYLANGNPASLVRCKVDYKTKSWTVVETYRDGMAKCSLWKSGNTLFRIFPRNGKLHFFTTNAMMPMIATIYDPIDRTMRVTNASCNPLSDGDFWNDLNDDGITQPGEMVNFGQLVGGSIAGSGFTLFTTPEPSGGKGGSKLTPKSFTAGGTPIYDFDKNITWPEWNENGESYRCRDIISAPDGGWYACISDPFKYPKANHGAWYFNSCSGIDRLVKWDADWKQIWSVGRHSPDNDQETGSTAMPRGLVGATHNCIIWADASDEEIACPVVWTDDGLYVDEFLRVPIDGQPKQIYGRDNVVEFALGSVETDKTSGDVYYYAVNTGGGSPVYRISGWDKWDRQSGKVELKSPIAEVLKNDGNGLKAEYFNAPDCSGKPVLSKTDSIVNFHWLKGCDSLPSGINKNNFSVRWTGRVTAPITDKYRFVFETMTAWVGGAWGLQGAPKWIKLWVGSKLLIDSKAGIFHTSTFAPPVTYIGANGQMIWVEPSPENPLTGTDLAVYGEAFLQAGQHYDLRLECNYEGNAVAKLCWETPESDRRVIRTKFLNTESGSKQNVTFENKRPELIANFDFEKPDGVLCYSKEGGDIFGRFVGDVRIVPGKTGQGVEFHPNGKYEPAIFPIDEELRLPDTNYSVVFWFKTTASETRLCETLRYSKYNNIFSDHIISIEQGKVSFLLQGDTALKTSNTFNDGKWHQVVTTVGDGGQKLYVDGKLIATGNLKKRTKTSNRLGFDLGSGEGNAVVSMDELRVYGLCLSPEKVKSLF